MPKDDEIINNEIDNELGRDEIDVEALEKVTREMNRAQLFKEIIQPDYHEQIKYEIGGKTITPFTKELKTSYLRAFDIALVEELSDLANLLIRVGAINTAMTLLQFRDIKLSAAPSRDAALLRLMNTEYSFKRIGVDKKPRQFFSRSSGGEET